MVAFVFDEETDHRAFLLHVTAHVVELGLVFEDGALHLGVRSASLACGAQRSVVVGILDCLLGFVGVVSESVESVVRVNAVVLVDRTGDVAADLLWGCAGRVLRADCP